MCLADGRLLVLGGVNPSCRSVDGRETSMLNSSELLAPGAEAWAAGPPMVPPPAPTQPITSRGVLHELVC